MLATLTSCADALKLKLISKETRLAERYLEDMHKQIEDNAWAISSLADNIEDSLLRDSIAYCAMGIIDALYEEELGDALDDIIYVSESPEGND